TSRSGGVTCGQQVRVGGERAAADLGVHQRGVAVPPIGSQQQAVPPAARVWKHEGGAADVLMAQVANEDGSELAQLEYARGEAAAAMPAAEEPFAGGERLGIGAPGVLATCLQRLTVVVVLVDAEMVGIGDVGGRIRERLLGIVAAERDPPAHDARELLEQLGRG